jgi:hypothetical protein
MSPGCNRHRVPAGDCHDGRLGTWPSGRAAPPAWSGEPAAPVPRRVAAGSSDLLWDARGCLAWPSRPGGLSAGPHGGSPDTFGRSIRPCISSDTGRDGLRGSARPTVPAVRGGGRWRPFRRRSGWRGRLGPWRPGEPGGVGGAKITAMRNSTGSSANEHQEPKGDMVSHGCTGHWPPPPTVANLTGPAGPGPGQRKPSPGSWG